METKICTICGKEFTPKHFNQTRCSAPHFKQCPICGKQIPWTEYDKCCSKECATVRRKATCIEKYGTPFAQQSDAVKGKSKQTCLDRYGVEAPAQNKDILAKQHETFDLHYGKITNPEGFKNLQERRILANIEKYGVENYGSTPEAAEKRKLTSLIKYGVENPMQCTEVQQRMKSTVQQKYGVSNVMQSEEVCSKLKQTNQTRYGYTSALASPEIRDRISQTISERYGVPWYCMTDECKQASGKIVSKLNKSIAKLLTEAGHEVSMEFRLDNKSYDLMVDNTTLIEIDPTFTHNSLFNPFDKSESGLDPVYHLNKTEVADNHGYRCIHIFDWDSVHKLVALLAPRERIYGRSAQIYIPTSEECSAFLDAHHIQSSCRGSEVLVGLTYRGELMSVATFGKPRYNRNYQWELLRLCTRPGYTVVGGASKMFQHFIQSNDPESVISYCNLSKFSGSVYSEMGFTLTGTSSPNKVWSKDTDYITNNLLLQKGYDKLFGTNYGTGTSNEELMISAGWLPVYDCGQKIFEWRNEK